MADPLSIAASVAGLITLAASTTKLVKAVSDRYTSQVSSFIQSNMQTLEETLGIVRKGVWTYEFTRPGEENLRHSIDSCAQTLRELSINFRKLHPKEFSLQENWEYSISLKNLQRKLARPETLKEIERLQAVLESQKVTLLIAMQTCSGASQFDMLVMIFNIVQKLSISRESAESEFTGADYSPYGDYNPYEDSFVMFEADGDRLKTQSLAQTFPSFEDWLSTWTASGEELDASAALLSGEPLNGLPSAGSAEQPGHSTVKLVIEGLRKDSASEWVTKEIMAPRHTPLYEIISLLNSQEYELTCGFTDAVDGTEFSPVLPWNTSLVVITDGSSSYDVETGLRINQKQSLVEFYNECLRKVAAPNSSVSLSIEKRGSTLTVQDAVDPRIASDITFQRTLRLPEDGKLHGTSAFLGPFPLFAAEEHASRLPPVMCSKGGIFFPMFQREGLAISFSRRNVDTLPVYRENHQEHFAIKVHAGSINCLSGRTASETDDEPGTNYIVCPRQPRLDGYRSADGSVRQFVAMPLGWDYSAEHQITGHEFVGGIQLEIASRLRDRVEFRSLGDLWHFGKALRLRSTAEDLGFKIGDVLTMTDFDDHNEILDESELAFTDSTRWSEQSLLNPMDSVDHRISTVQDILQQAKHRVKESDDGIRLRTVNPVLVHLKIVLGKRTPIEESLRCSPYLDLGSLATQRLHYYDLDCGHCKYCNKYNYTYPEWKLDSEHSALTCGRGWPAQSCQLRSLPAPYSLVNGQLRIVCTQLSPGYRHHYRVNEPDDSAPYPLAAVASAAKVADWQVALGAGARLLQQIYKDSSPQCWDWRNSRFINLQILNAVAFQSVTGIPAWTPVSLKDYQEKQLTLQVPLSSEKDHDETIPESTMPELHGVGALDRETTHHVRRKRLMVLCPQCEINMCNVILLPCKHLFCSDCMSNSTTCLQCTMTWTEKTTLSGVMDHPSNGQARDSKPFRLLTPEDMCEQLKAIPHYLTSHGHPRTADDVAKEIASMELGQHGIFWYNFVVSILKKSEGQIRRCVAKALILSNTKAGHVHRVELVLGLVSLMDYTQEVIAGQGIGDLLGASVDNIRRPDDDGHPEARKASTCLEAIIDWMTKQGIDPQHLADWSYDAKDLLRPQAAQSLRRVVDFLVSDGRSLTEDYGVTVFITNKFHSGSLRPDDRELQHALLQTLVANGVDINARDHLGRTMLWKDTAPLHSFLDCGARADVPDNGGNTVLHHLVAQARYPGPHNSIKARIAELLGHGGGRAAVDARNRGGLTALHLAMGIDPLWDWMGFTGLLVGGGADASLPIPQGDYRDEVGRLAAKWESEVGRFDVLMRKSAEKRLQTVRGVLDISPTVG